MASERTSMIPFGGVVFLDTNKDSMSPFGGVVSIQDLTSGPSGAILKRYVGAAWVAFDLKDYDVSWDNFVLKKYISASWQTIDSDGT